MFCRTLAGVACTLTLLGCAIHTPPPAPAPLPLEIRCPPEKIELVCKPYPDLPVTASIEWMRKLITEDLKELYAECASIPGVWARGWHGCDGDEQP